MIVPKQKICDLCCRVVGVNRRYYIIKSKALFVGSAGSCADNKKHHICDECMAEICNHIREKEG